jgi:Holliday junction resolvase RusA-like endonuclease
MAVLKHRWIGKIPSTNNWTRVRVINQKGKHIPIVYETGEFKKFKNALADSLVYPGRPKLEGYFDLRLKVSLWKVRDSDNAIKPVMDALEQSGVIQNDKFIRNIVVVRAYHSKNEADVLEIELFNIKEQDQSWAKNNILF